MKKRPFYKWMSRLCTLMMGLMTAAAIAIVSLVIWKPSGEEFQFGIHIGVFHFQSSELVFSAILWLPLCLNFLLLLALMWNVRAFFKNLSHEKIFVDQNARLMIRTGMVLFVLAFTFNLLPFLAAQSLMPDLQYEAGQILINYSVKWELILSSVSIVVIGMIFKEAVRIVEESKLTI